MEPAQISTAEPLLIAAICLVFLFGGAVKGAMGFGLPLVTIAILPFLMPVEAALAVNALVLLATNVLQVVQAGHVREAVRIATPMLAGLAVATPIGTAIAAEVPRALLLGLLGAFIIGFSLLSLRMPAARAGDAPPTPAGWRGIGAGLAGGLVGAFTSTPGPIFVMHLAHLAMPRPLFMATLGVLMGAVGAVLAASLAVTGALDGARALLGLAALPTAFAGFWLGDQIGRRFSVEAFRKAVLLLLIVLGALMIGRAAGV